MSAVRRARLVRASECGGMMRSERHRRYLAEAAFGHGVNPADILGRSRKWKVVRARREMMCRYREAGYSLPQIGALFDRSRSTRSAPLML
jgi:hypothetical protein